MATNMSGIGTIFCTLKACHESPKRVALKNIPLKPKSYIKKHQPRNIGKHLAYSVTVTSNFFTLSS